jgi:hypothetical protein
MKDQGATVVINHHILDGKQSLYEEWLNEIMPICRSFKGHIDLQIIRPIPKLTFNYTVIIRFDTIENLKLWMESSERRDLISKAKPLFAKDDRYFIQSGLEFLFSNENEGQKVPVRWKQYLVTWSAIYPLSIVIPMLVLPVLRALNFPESKLINSFFISGLIVLIMVYLLMPRYTRAVKQWLYK